MANAQLSARSAGHVEPRWRTQPDGAARSGSSRRSATRTAFGRVALASIGLLLPLLLLEAGFRLFGPVAPGEYQTTRLVEASERFGRQNMANRGGWKSSSEYRVHVRVNSQGLRGPEIPYAKPEGVQRVLVLGDSFTFGAQVDEEQTFVARLGEHLRAGTAASDLTVGPIETINAGVDGWTTINQVTWLQAEGLRYAPDLVVLMYYTGNDPGENYDYVKALGRVGAVPVPSAEPSSRSVQHFLLDRSHAYTAFETGVLQKLRPAEEPADLDDEVALNVRRSADPERKAAGWELSGDLIRQLRALCDERGIRLVVVGIPTVEHVINVDREPTPIRAISERAGVPVVDLLDAFRAAPGRALGTLYFPKDRHWTPAGHELAATEMAAVIAEMDLIRTATDRSLTR